MKDTQKLKGSEVDLQDSKCKECFVSVEDHKEKFHSDVETVTDFNGIQ